MGKLKLIYINILDLFHHENNCIFSFSGGMHLSQKGFKGRSPLAQSPPRPPQAGGVGVFGSPGLDRDAPCLWEQFTLSLMRLTNIRIFFLFLLYFLPQYYLTIMKAYAHLVASKTCCLGVKF